MVLRNCIETGTTEQKEILANEITKEALYLAQHPFGNYAVQHVLKGVAGTAAASNVFDKLVGKFVDLSLLKFSSNVVENVVEKSHQQLTRQLLVKRQFAAPLTVQP